MKRTAEQEWYKAPKRRRKLLKRRNVIILHSITTADPPEVSGDRADFSTSDGKYKITLPKAVADTSVQVKSIIKKGTIVHAPNLLTDEQIEAVLTDYVVIQTRGWNMAVDFFPNDPEHVVLIYLTPVDKPPFGFKDWLIVDPGDIENFPPGGKPFVTTYGRYFVNYYLIATTFMEDQSDDWKIPKELEFVNAKWNIKKFENQLSLLLTEEKIKVHQCDAYIDHGYYMASFGELCGTVFTKKALVPSADLIKRRKELLKQYEKDLADPRIMAIIDNELVAMDKAYLQGDPSMDFFLSQKENVFTVERKKQYSAIGMIETFGGQKGNYIYVNTSLTEGVQPENFAEVMNEARKGFYSRAVETQIAGVDTKLMIAVFQNVRITSEDCRTDQCLEIVIEKEVASNFLGQYVQIRPGHYEPLSRENIDRYIGKKVKIRSFMHCQQPDGYCMKCAGEKFKLLDYRNPGVLAIDVGGVFINMSMNAMHGKSVKTMDLESLDDYILNP